MKVNLLFILLFGTCSFVFCQNEVTIIKDSVCASSIRPDLKGTCVIYHFSLLEDSSYYSLGDTITIKVSSVSGQSIIKKFICFKNPENNAIQYSLAVTVNSGPNILFSKKSNGMYSVIVLSTSPEDYCHLNFEIYSKSRNTRFIAPVRNLKGCF